MWWKYGRDDQESYCEQNIETYALEELFVTVSGVTEPWVYSFALTCAKKAMYQ